MSGDERPVLRVVSGSPTAEELAVVTALVVAASAASGDEPPVHRGRRGRWNDPAAAHRRPLLPGPNGWRAAGFG
jgi:Acyl-CoA carboxylase epsilon subunit